MCKWRFICDYYVNIYDEWRSKCLSFDANDAECAMKRAQFANDWQSFRRSKNVLWNDWRQENSVCFRSYQRCCCNVNIYEPNRLLFLSLSISIGNRIYTVRHDKSNEMTATKPVLSMVVSLFQQHQSECLYIVYHRHYAVMILYIVYMIQYNTWALHIETKNMIHVQFIHFNRQADSQDRLAWLLCSSQFTTIAWFILAVWSVDKQRSKFLEITSSLRWS